MHAASLPLQIPMRFLPCSQSIRQVSPSRSIAACSESMIVDALPTHVLVPIRFSITFWYSWPNAVSRHNSRTFEHGIELVGGQIGERLDGSRRPRNLDAIDFFGRAQTKVQASVILGEIAAAAVHFVGLGHPTRCKSDSGTNRHAIAFGARQIEADPIAAWYAVVFQNHRSAVEVTDDHVHIAVVEEIAYSQAS